MEDEILRFAKTDNAVNAKALIEIINSLDIADCQIKYRQANQGWLNRLKDSITGKAAARQNLIDENLASGLRNMWEYAKDIRLDQTRLARLGTRLAEDIQLLQENMAILGTHMLRFDEELSTFRNSITRQLESLEARYDRLSRIQQGRLQLDACAGRLKLGHYSRFSLPGQLCHVAAELAYGPFHAAISRHPDCRQEMLDIAASTLSGVAAELLKRPASSPQPWRVWQPQRPEPLEKEIIGYLAGPDNPQDRPITARSLKPELSGHSSIPAFITANSLAERILTEMLEQEDCG